jgi:hypothetical protein
MPSVHPGHIDIPAVGGSDQHPAGSDHGHCHTRVAVGGRVIERELNDREPSADKVGNVVSQ